MRIRRKIATLSITLSFGAVFCASLLSFTPRAEACCSCAGTIIPLSTTEWFAAPSGSSPRIRDHVTSEFTAHRVWLVSIFWEDNLLPALMMMSDQLTAVAMQQVQIIGSFFDAKHQMETQQLFGEMRARAHKDYHPSVGMCQFGSGIRSLAATERQAELNAHVLSQRSQDRALGNANTAAAEGNDNDKSSRLKQFREKYCDPEDNNSGLKYLCDHDQDNNPGNGQVGAADKHRMNKDIDFVRTVEFPWTLDVDFTDTVLKDEEEDIMALSANLYGTDVFKRPSPSLFKSDSAGALERAYLDARSVLAKRSVAENSFNAITSMKATGTGGSRDFLAALLEELGVGTTGSPPDIDKLLGQDSSGNPINPSYYAQMEILTKKIYQNPDFYTNLYDTPANVDRKGVALQAIALMQKFDMFKSYLRSEANLSVLLELAVMDLQEEIEDEFGKKGEEGETPD
ncbi:MAG: hypothetical protein R3D66_06970 [Alphaproteobacteria bacterium]